MRSVLLGTLLEGQDLDDAQVRNLVGRLVDPRTTDIERAALLVALRAKGESPAEIEAFAREMRRRAVPFPYARARGAVDLCGSGGARVPSFNIGTVSALVTRAAGLPIAKHGNRSARGNSQGYAGSSDLIEALGLPYLVSRRFAEESFRREGIAFLHAPLYHPATHSVMPVRRALGVPTIFNALGPLTNPARVRCQVVGCTDTEAAERVARILPRLGVTRGLTVVGAGGADEFSPRGVSQLIVWQDGIERRRTIDAAAYLDPEDRRGPWGPLPASAAAEETDRILAGGGGARRGSVLLTSGAALWAGGRAASMRTGVAQAQVALDDGSAAALLERLRTLAGSRQWDGGES
jgi:anthranilate phosphoribosyltransferase